MGLPPALAALAAAASQPGATGHALFYLVGEVLDGLPFTCAEVPRSSRRAAAFPARRARSVW
jgi:hypothetical protein